MLVAGSAGDGAQRCTDGVGLLARIAGAPQMARSYSGVAEWVMKLQFKVLFVYGD